MRSAFLVFVTILAYYLGNSLGEELSAWHEALEASQEYFGSTGYFIVRSGDSWFGWLTGVIAHFYGHRFLWSDFDVLS